MTLWQHFMVDHPFYLFILSLSAVFLTECDWCKCDTMHNCALCRICTNHIQMWTVATRKLISQTKVAIRPTNYNIWDTPFNWYFWRHNHARVQAISNLWSQFVSVMYVVFSTSVSYTSHPVQYIFPAGIKGDIHNTVVITDVCILQTRSIVVKY